VELRDYLRVFRRQLALIVAITLLGAAAAAAYTFRRTPVYESTASVLVSPTATPTGGEDSHGQLSMRDERQMVRSVAVASIITRRFRTSTTPEQLLRQVSVETSAESRVLRITFTDPVPATARTGADAFAVAYLDYRRRAVGANLRSLAAKLAPTRPGDDASARKSWRCTRGHLSCDPPAGRPESQRRGGVSGPLFAVCP
jgi:uncharacterized protein involved in exopolysaccharide biosynthesis